MWTNTGVSLLATEGFAAICAVALSCVELPCLLGRPQKGPVLIQTGDGICERSPGCEVTLRCALAGGGESRIGFVHNFLEYEPQCPEGWSSYYIQPICNAMQTIWANQVPASSSQGVV